MKTSAIACLTGLFVLCAAVAVADPSPGNRAEVPEKDSQPTGVPTYEGRVEGDTVEDPFVIDDLPFTGSGDTCPFANDYDASCPYTGSTSPDVVYRYDCQYTSPIIIDLCASQYDTKVYVYENEYVNGGEIDCNDDYPGCGPNGYRSWLMLEFYQGNTYYIVVDGYTGDCGVYELYIQNYITCAPCPGGAFIETEPYCMDPENDIDNRGCNSDPPIFDYLEPSEEVIDFCGTSGTYVQSGSTWRDTDWFQIDLASASEITFRGIAQFSLRIGIVDGREGCEETLGFYSYTDTAPCDVAELIETLPAGTWWLWVGPVAYTGVQCGEPYACEVTGYTPVTPVESATWSTLKALFRTDPR
jgi:hypothetical protein